MAPYKGVSIAICWIETLGINPMWEDHQWSHAPQHDDTALSCGSIWPGNNGFHARQNVGSLITTEHGGHRLSTQ